LSLWGRAEKPRGTSTTGRNLPSVGCLLVHVPATCHRTCAVTATSPADVIPCHVSPIDWSSCLSYATSPATCRLRGLPRHPYGQHATWHCTDCTVIPPPPFFSFLGSRTERDVFRIRSPLDEVGIWPESGRRDGRNGAGFVGSGALSFLSLFGPCRASGSSVMSVEEGEGA